MDSIITQVNREDEQLNAFANDKGNKSGKLRNFDYCPNICVDEKNRCCFSVALSRASNSLDEQAKRRKKKSNSCV